MRVYVFVCLYVFMYVDSNPDPTFFGAISFSPSFYQNLAFQPFKNCVDFFRNQYFVFCVEYGNGQNENVSHMDRSEENLTNSEKNNCCKI